MLISCTYCDTKLRIDKSLVKVDGSKVRCAQCDDIFMIHPPNNNTEPRILGKNKVTEMAASDIEIKESDDRPIENNEPADELGEVAENGDIEHANLPDLSDIEEIVDSLFDDKDHINKISPFILTKYRLSEDLNFSAE